MKGIRFMVDFFAVDGSGNRYIKYRQGEVYPPTEETTSQVIAGFAEEVDAGVDAEVEVQALVQEPQVQEPQVQLPADESMPMQSTPEAKAAEQSEMSLED